jgi:serine/threonine protein phosphatase 1
MRKPPFVHAGFTNMNGVAYEFFPKLFYWDRTLWETALSLDRSIKPNDLLYPKRLTLYDEIHRPITCNSALVKQNCTKWFVSGI